MLPLRDALTYVISAAMLLKEGEHIIHCLLCDRIDHFRKSVSSRRSIQAQLSLIGSRHRYTGSEHQRFHAEWLHGKIISPIAQRVNVGLSIGHACVKMMGGIMDMIGTGHTLEFKKD